MRAPEFKRSLNLHRASKIVPGMERRTSHLKLLGQQQQYVVNPGHISGVSHTAHWFRELLGSSWAYIFTLLFIVLVVVSLLGALLLLPIREAVEVAGSDGGGQGQKFLGLVLLAFSNLLSLGCEFGQPRTQPGQLVVVCLNLLGLVLTTALLSVAVTKLSNKPHTIVFSKSICVGRYIDDAPCFRWRVGNSTGRTVLQPSIRLVVLLHDEERATARKADPGIFVMPLKMVPVALSDPWGEGATLPACIYLQHVVDEASPFYRPLSERERPDSASYSLKNMKTLRMSVVGTDAQTGGTVFGTKIYTAKDFKEGARFVDCMDLGGNIDFANFDKLEVNEPVEKETPQVLPQEVQVETLGTDESNDGVMPHGSGALPTVSEL